jgi:hypothetical protein
MEKAIGTSPPHVFNRKSQTCPETCMMDISSNRECSATMPEIQWHCARRHSVWDRKRLYHKSTMCLPGWT